MRKIEKEYNLKKFGITGVAGYIAPRHLLFSSQIYNMDKK